MNRQGADRKVGIIGADAVGSADERAQIQRIAERQRAAGDRLRVATASS